MLEILTLPPAIVKPAEVETATPAVSLAADDADDSWVWSDDYADAMAEDATDLDRVCSGACPF